MGLENYRIGETTRWNNGGDGQNRNFALSVNSLADDAAWAGAKGSLCLQGNNKHWNRLWLAWIGWKPAALVAASTTLEVRWIPSRSPKPYVDNPFGYGGKDLLYTAQFDLEAEILAFPLIGTLTLPDANAAVVAPLVVPHLLWTAPSPYGAPIIVNRSGEASATASADIYVEFTQVIPVR